MLDKTQDMVYNDGAPLPGRGAVIVTKNRASRYRQHRADERKTGRERLADGRIYEAYKEKRSRGRI